MLASYHVSRTAAMLAVVTAFLLAAAAGPARAWQDLIGQKPPVWGEMRWINSAPLDLEGLRGNVVLVRWWTAPDCPFCGASAVALNDWHARFAPQGLCVVGFYHHKVSAPLSEERIEAYVKRFGFEFPVAIDRNWRALRDWWLDGSRREWTSVSFLLDRRGVIRHIHPGGAYRQGDAAHSAMEDAIIELLAEPASLAEPTRR